MNVLFLSATNAARSIVAEAIFNHLATRAHTAYSAGSRPAGAVNPLAFAVLGDEGIDSHGLYSKSWSVFTDSPDFDLVVTLCDEVAKESPPAWPGSPNTVHWKIAKPETRPDFEAAYRALDARIQGLVSAL